MSDETEPFRESRRGALTKLAGGAGLAAGTWGSPLISGIGIAPVDAEACSSPPPPPEWTCTPNTTPTCGAVTTASGAGVATNIQTISRTGNSTVSGQVAQAQRDTLADGVSIDYQVQTCRPTALCPGQTGSYSSTFSVDFCTFYNSALADAKAGVVAGGGTLLGFSISVSNIQVTWAGQTVTFPDFSSNSLTPIGACPQSRTINVPVTVDDYPAIVLDPVTCVYDCPSVPSPAIPAAFSTPPVITATQQVYTQVRVVVIFALTGAATTKADLSGSGQIPPSPGVVPVPAICG